MAIEKRPAKRAPEGFVYRVRWPDPHTPGSWLSETFDNLNDARTWDALWRVKQRQGTLGQLDAGSELLGEYLGKWLRNWVRAGKAKKTVRETRRVIDRLILQVEKNGAGEETWARDSIAWLQLRQVDARVIEKWLHNLEDEGVGAESRRKALYVLSQVFRRAVSFRDYPHGANPVDAIEKPKATARRAVEPLQVTIDHVERMRSYFLSRGETMSATLVAALAYSGCRPGELLACQVKHFAEHKDDDGKVTWKLRVEQRNSLGEVLEGAKSTKRRARTVVLPAALVEDIQRWLERGEPVPDSPLFPDPSGGYWNESRYRNWRRRDYKPAAAAAGIADDDTHPYLLRHVAISLWYASGMTSIEAAERAGHAPSLSTDTYAKVLEAYAGKGPIDIDAEITAARARHNPGQEAS